MEKCGVFYVVHYLVQVFGWHETITTSCMWMHVDGQIDRQTDRLTAILCRPDRLECVVHYLVQVFDWHETVVTKSVMHRPPFLLIFPQQRHHLTLGY